MTEAFRELDPNMTPDADVAPLDFTRASDWQGKPVPERQWLVPDVIPMGTVTALYGNGGDGKSLLLAQLGVASATGRPWLGMPTRKGPALILAAEDDLDELHRRTVRICEVEGVALPADLYIRSAIEDGHLADLDPRKGIVANALYHRLRATVAHLRPSLIGLDTLGPLFPGNENDRAQATTFVNMLKGLATECGSAVVLLAHPSLTGMSSGSGLSGSTAWNGSVRSRLYLDRITDGGHEPDPRRRRLSVKKANYGPTGGEIMLTWTDGVYIADAPETALDRKAGNAKAERVFLKLLDLFTAQGRQVNASSGPNYAPAVFAKHPESEGCNKHALRPAMEALLTAGKVRVVHGGPPSRPVTWLEAAE